MKEWIKIWIVPGAVFQSVTIGGGYGTGREVVEFISKGGPQSGMASVVLIAILFSVMLGFCFDLARTLRAYDYRSFMKRLLGPAWVLYELTFILGLMLVLAISGSAAGTLLNQNFGWPMFSGIVLMLLVIVILTYLGRVWVEKTLTAWSVLISLLLIVYAIAVLTNHSTTITATFESDELGADWWRNGARFFLYNVIIIPTLLYATRSISSRKQAWGAGLIGGTLAALPALIYHLTFMSQYPEILDESLPTFHIVRDLNMPVLLFAYIVILFGTIATTGAGILHGFNERLDMWWQQMHGRSISKWLHSAIAGSAVLASMLLANLGIVALVAKGYGALAWVSLVLLILPLLTIGVWKMVKHGDRLAAPHKQPPH
jgi:uncharacterized membrane protein YkvI